jgi:hypothetical protein
MGMKKITDEMINAELNQYDDFKYLSEKSIHTDGFIKGANFVINYMKEGGK